MNNYNEVYTLEITCGKCHKPFKQTYETTEPNAMVYCPHCKEEIEEFEYRESLKLTLDLEKKRVVCVEEPDFEEITADKCRIYVKMTKEYFDDNKEAVLKQLSFTNKKITIIETIERTYP